MTNDELREIEEEYSSIMGMPPCVHCKRFPECEELGTIEMLAHIGATSCGQFDIRSPFTIREMIEDLKDKIIYIRKKWRRNRLIVRRRRAFAREIAQALAKALRKEGGAL